MPPVSPIAAAALKAVSGALDVISKGLENLIGTNALSALLTEALGDKANDTGAPDLIKAVSTIVTCVLKTVLDAIKAVLAVVNAILSGSTIPAEPTSVS